MITKILLTGAGGFIGSHIVDKLNEDSVDFLNLSNVMGNFKYPDKAVLLPLADKDGMIKAIKEFRPDAVIHMAAIASPAHKNASEIYDVNVCGTENLLEAIKQTCSNGVRVILFSTAGVYGNQNLEFFSETDAIKPVNHYSGSKAVMEYLSHNYDDCMEIRVVRPFNIIGTGQSEMFIVPKLLKAFLNRIPEISLGNLSAVRDYVSVEFCATAIINYLFYDSTEYPVLNICSGIGNSVQDVFDALVLLTGISPKIKISEDIVRHNEIWRLVGSTKKLDTIMQSQKSLCLKDILLQMMNSIKI